MNRLLAENARKQEVDLVWSCAFLFLILLSATFSTLTDPRPDAARDASVEVAERDAAAPPPALRIRVGVGGAVTVEEWGADIIGAADLQARLERLDSTLVILSPDRDVTYGTTAPLLRLIREAGHATALDVSPN